MCRKQNLHYSHAPEDTIKPRWFLVQVNYDEIDILKMNSFRTGDYHVTFLSRHLDDKHLCDDDARWSPEWYGYYLDDKNISVCGACIPKWKWNLKKYMLWTVFSLFNRSFLFYQWTIQFYSQFDIISTKQYIVLPDREFLLTSCNDFRYYTPNNFQPTNKMPKKKKRNKVIWAQL